MFVDATIIRILLVPATCHPWRLELVARRPQSTFHAEFGSVPIGVQALVLRVTA